MFRKNPKTFIAFVIALGSMTATAANAQTATLVNYSGSNGTTVNFDSPLPNGFSLTGGRVTTGNTQIQTQPVGSTGHYLTTDIGSATLKTTTGYDGVSFLWGTASNDNSASFFDTLGQLVGTISGASLALPYNSSNYVTYTLDPASGRKLGSVQLASNTFSFEADNFTFFNNGNGGGAPAPVPEPATLALFGLGLAALFALSRKRPALNV